MVESIEYLWIIYAFYAQLADLRGRQQVKACPLDKVMSWMGNVHFSPNDGMTRTSEGKERAGTQKAIPSPGFRIVYMIMDIGEYAFVWERDEVKIWTAA